MKKEEEEEEEEEKEKCLLSWQSQEKDRQIMRKKSMIRKFYDTVDSDNIVGKSPVG